MKKYHLTAIRDGKYITIFCETRSIALFISIEKEVGREFHIIYLRELNDEEYSYAKSCGL